MTDQQQDDSFLRADGRGGAGRCYHHRIDQQGVVTNRRRSLLIAALGFSLLEPGDPPWVLTALKRWLGSWTGIGAIIVGMSRQGFNVELREYPDGWRANFYPAGTAHSIVVGSAWEPTPWRAVQRAAWTALTVRPN